MKPSELDERCHAFLQSESCYALWSLFLSHEYYMDAIERGEDGRSVSVLSDANPLNMPIMFKGLVVLMVAGPLE